MAVEQWRVRSAITGDAQAIARLHAESWRRHYRGAYSDEFLDGDVVSDRISVWTERLRAADPRTSTLVAEDAGALLGFGHVAFADHPVWGALLDNLHVDHRHQRSGIGSRLLRLIASRVSDQSTGLYLWVQEQNMGAQAFYEAQGGRCVERASIPAPGGVPGRLKGTPSKLRLVWKPEEVRQLSARSG